MAQNHKYSGKVIPLVLLAAAVKGVPFLMGSKLVVPLASGGVGDSISVATDEAWELPKTTGQAWAAGAALYWDDTTKKLTTTVGSNTLQGYACEPALTADATGIVNLNN
jgi:predicted RecA/RadA family phage recombinase